jgi:hypothetical protein
MLYEFRVDAAPQEQGGAGVPEVVPANRGQTSTLEQRLEVAVDHVLGVQRGTLARGENEVRIFVMCRP